MTLKFGNVELKDKYFRLISIDEEMIPYISNDTIRNPNGLGEIIMRKSLSAKRIVLTGRIAATDKDTRSERIADLASTLLTASIETIEDQKLELPDREHYYLARLDGRTPLRPFINSADVEIAFICTDPLAYGNDKTVPIPETVVVACDFSVVPEITVTFESAESSFELANTTTGEFMEIIHEFSVSDVLVINSEDESVKLNGTSIMQDLTYGSDHIRLAVGNNVITSTHPASLKYTERYLY